MPSPKIHILGAGSIGALVGTALSCNMPPAYVTYLMRSKERLRDYAENGNVVRVESKGNKVERKIDAVFPYEQQRNGDPLPIDNLIVTTKGHHTRNALKQIMPSLHPRTNILLMQNGLGVYDTVVKQLWPGKGDRPKISLGVTSHAVHKVGPWSFSNANPRGFFKVAELPTNDDKMELTMAGATDAEQNVKAEYMEDPLERGSNPATHHTHIPTDSEESVKADHHFATSTSAKPDVEDTSMPTDSEEAVKADHSPIVKTTRENENPILKALTGNGMLNTEVMPYPELLLAQYEKLVINAVINPITAILGVRNGKLQELGSLKNLIESCVAESCRVIRKHAESKYTAETLFVLNSSLDPKRMTELVMEMIESTAGNLSSMAADVERLETTELEFINDFIVKLAIEQNMSAKNNQMLSALVKARLGALRSQNEKFAPYV